MIEDGGTVRLDVVIHYLGDGLLRENGSVVVLHEMANDLLDKRLVEDGCPVLRNVVAHNLYENALAKYLHIVFFYVFFKYSTDCFCVEHNIAMHIHVVSYHLRE